MERNGNQQDPRYIRTETTIQKTFREMISEMPYADMSVKELMERAGLNKKTFYLHYTNLDELLMSVKQEVFSDTLANVSNYLIPEDLPALIDMLYRSWHKESPENLAILEAAYTQNGISFYDSMMAVNWKFSEQWLKVDMNQQKMLVSFLAKGLLHIYYEWTSAQDRMSLDDLISFTQRVFTKGILY